jgi:hypothetical protein
VSVGNASELINNKLSTHVLHIRIIGVRKMLRVNALTIVGANTVTLQRSKVSIPGFLPTKHARGAKTYGSANVQ